MLNFNKTVEDCRLDSFDYMYSQYSTNLARNALVTDQLRHRQSNRMQRAGDEISHKR